jgi:hypothetical protein
MKRVVIVMGVVVTAVASAAGAAGQSGGGPYELAHTWGTPLGVTYGPVHAGPQTSALYGFVAK